ncbi:ATP-binding protein [Streptomyces sp. NPDC002730]|uniref:ATP-binding protein n=1 Tax=Streptomyces sp. NPDC002730 TaxID=3364662 RepID=UPI0036B13511
MREDLAMTTDTRAGHFVKSQSTGCSSRGDPRHIFATAAWSQPTSLTAPREMRTNVVRLLTAWRLRAEGGDLELLLSELVTNACRHAPGIVHVEVWLDRHRLTVYVRDGGCGKPQLELTPTESEDVDDLRTGGYGLLLMRELAVAYGMTTDRNGTIVWFQIPRPKADGAQDE